MNCEKIKEQLSAYIDDELSEEDADFIREHIAVCASCGHEEQLLRRTSELLRCSSFRFNVRAPDGFYEVLMAGAGAEDTGRMKDEGGRMNFFLHPLSFILRFFARPRALIRMAACATAVLLLCVGLIFFAWIPLKKAPMVEPLPTYMGEATESAIQSVDNAIQPFESFPRYTTMAEMKTSGI